MSRYAGWTAGSRTIRCDHIMYGILCDQHGPPDVMQYRTLPDPQPAADEVVIKAEAIGVNYVDTMRRSGGHPSAPPAPLTPGIEVCGRIVAIGTNVTRFTTGDRVIGRCVTTGAYAELVAVQERFTVACPESIPANQAAGLFVNPQTAFHALHTMGHVQPDDSVLVTAAAGGVGLCAVQMARTARARVIALAGSSEKLELASRFGADVTIDYTQAGWPDAVRSATDGGGAGLVLDSVGGETTAGCVACWAPGGRLVIYGQATGVPGLVPGDELLFGNRIVHGLAVGTVIEDEELMRSAMEQIFEQYHSGQLKIHIGLKLPLRDAPEAHRQLEARRTSGKIILLP